MIHSDFVQANGLRLHYLHQPTTDSTKPTLLLLHGLTDSAACWTPVIEALQGDYNIVALDARGHGLSDAPAHGYSPVDHAEDAAAFIHSLKLPKSIVFGHSMGGMEATVLAAHHPELVRALILEDPAWFDLAQQPHADERRTRADGNRANLRAQQAMPREALIASERAKNPRWSDAELGPWAVGRCQASGALAGAGICRACADGLARAAPNY